jgi:hypothetical protein
MQISLNSDKNYGYFTWRAMSVSYNMMLNSSEWEMFQIKIVEKIQNAHFLVNKFIPNIMPFTR